MDDAGVVGRPQTAGHLGREFEQPFGGDRPLTDLVAEFLALDVLGHDERQATVFADVVDRDDVRMVHAARGLGLFEELPAPGGILSGPGVQDLDRHFPSQARVPGAIDLSHAADVRGSADFVRPDPPGRSLIHVAPRLCAMS